MIRAVLAFFACLLLAGPAPAATQPECAALLDRLGLAADSITAPSGSCFYRGVSGDWGASRFRAEVLALFGDVDALPDALPARLTGGLVGLARAADPVGGTAPEADATPAPAVTITFTLAAGAGMLRLDTLALRTGGPAKADLTALLSGLPQVFPPEPRALARMRLDTLETRVDAAGLLDVLVGALAPDGRGPDDLRRSGAAWLDAVGARDGQGDNVEAMRRALEATPDAPGTLRATLAGTGVTLLDLTPILTGAGLDPVRAARLARDADLALTWEPGAP